MKKSWSRKEDLIKRIRMARFEIVNCGNDKLAMEFALDSTKNFKRKTVSQLERIWADDYSNMMFWRELAEKELAEQAYA